jgi:DNA-binding NarL/FixJ family response regulator
MVHLAAHAAVVLIHSHLLIGKALKPMLLAAGLAVVGEATAGDDTVELVRGLRPDLVLFELIPGDGMAGIETIQQLTATVPDSRVLVLAASQEPDVALAALLAGASGFLLEESGPEEIVQGIEDSVAGECAISPAVAGHLIDQLREREAPANMGSDVTGEAIRAQLTDRELQIFKRLASGKSNREIGDQLSLSRNTVKNHVASILEKLQLDNRVQAAVQAVRAGMS